MVLKTRGKPFLSILFAILLTVFSCEKEFFVIVNCQECTSDEPRSAELIISFDSSPPVNSVVVTIYEGTDTNAPVIYTTLTQSGAEVSLVAALNRTYTAVAQYTYAGKTYRVTDSIRPSVKFTKSECDEACYYIYNNRMNLRLKYF